MRLKDKVAIITGAASGIGRAASLLFAGEGAQVAVVDLDEARGGQTVEAIRQQGGEAIFVQADVSRESEAAMIASKTAQEFGQINVLFNNAAVSNFKSAMETDEAEFDRVLGTNVKSVLFCAKAVIPYLKQLGGGSIINTSSITGIVGAPGMAAYSTSKGAIITLTRTMALELAEDNIRVNCLCPASIDTPMLQSSFDRQPDPQAARAANIKRHPIGRLGTAEDVAYFALFLASDESSFVTGGTHLIDGGASIARRWRE